MAILKKNPEEAAAKAAAKANAAEAAARQQAEQAFWYSPQGRARAAFTQGVELFQISIPLATTERVSVMGDFKDPRTSTNQGDHATLLSVIETEGWRLEQASYYFQQTGAQSREKMLSSGQSTVVTGEAVGVYIFRRRAVVGGDPT